jgi:16S rRNA (uracil1498-N3)-methyltransferase
MGHRVFCGELEIEEGRLKIRDKEILRHLIRAARIQKGEGLEVVVPGDKVYAVVVERIASQFLECRIVGESPVLSQSRPLTLACALPKNVGFDDIVDKATQLGVARIIPMETERTIVRLDAARKQARRQRWEKVARAAAEQSHRATVPEVSPVMSFSDALERTRDVPLRLIPALFGERRDLAEIFSEPAQGVAVFVGPEGDFSDAEVETARQQGVVPVSLGPLVLRVDTAALAVAAYAALQSALRKRS